MRIFYMVSKSNGEAVGFSESRVEAEEAVTELNAAHPEHAPYVVSVAQEQLEFKFLRDAP